MPVIIHQPPFKQTIPDSDRLLFIGGPIQGAPDWQPQVIELIQEEWDSRLPLHIANPRRQEKPQDFNYSEQVRWERYHIFRAIKFGGSMFWLACQDPSLPYKKDRAYAQTTRFEFGMAYTAARLGINSNISLGMDSEYKGSEKYYDDCADELSLPVYETLPRLCTDALLKAISAKRV